MLSVEDALTNILETIEPTAAEVVSLAQADGRVLAEDLHARRTHPSHDLSAMDGYAVRSADLASLPASLDVIEEIPAGKLPEKELAAGQSARIFTGAALPKGADSIALQEDVDGVETDRITVREMEVSRHVRVRGLDFEEGAVVAKKGTRLTPACIGLLAAANIPFVKVHARPTVAFLSTGSELVLPGEPFGPGQIISSNGLMLSALARQHGAYARDLGPVADEADQIIQAAHGFSGADICVTIGGASVGKHDLVQSVLTEHGLDVAFWKIAMRPGKPLIFGDYTGAPFLGLPGNPVSAFVCALLFLVPAIRKLSGEVNVTGSLDLTSYKTSTVLPPNGPRKTFLRATRSVDQPGYVTPRPIQDSSMMSALAAADCLIVRNPGAAEASQGDEVSILSLQ